MHFSIPKLNSFFTFLDNSTPSLALQSSILGTVLSVELFKGVRRDLAATRETERERSA